MKVSEIQAIFCRALNVSKSSAKVHPIPPFYSRLEQLSGRQLSSSRIRKSSTTRFLLATNKLMRGFKVISRVARRMVHQVRNVVLGSALVSLSSKGSRYSMGHLALRGMSCCLTTPKRYTDVMIRRVNQSLRGFSKKVNRLFNKSSSWKPSLDEVDTRVDALSVTFKLHAISNNYPKPSAPPMPPEMAAEYWETQARNYVVPPDPPIENHDYPKPSAPPMPPEMAAEYWETQARNYVVPPDPPIKRSFNMSCVTSLRNQFLLVQSKFKQQVVTPVTTLSKNLDELSVTIQQLMSVKMKKELLKSESSKSSRLIQGVAIGKYFAMNHELNLKMFGEERPEVKIHRLVKDIRHLVMQLNSIDYDVLSRELLGVLQGVSQLNHDCMNIPVQLSRINIQIQVLQEELRNLENQLQKLRNYVIIFQRKLLSVLLTLSSLDGWNRYIQSQISCALQQSSVQIVLVQAHYDSVVQFRRELLSQLA